MDTERVMRVMRVMRVLAWASALPIPLPDPKAARKLAAELVEFDEAMRGADYLGAVTELADVVYYAVKIIYAIITTPEMVNALVHQMQIIEQRAEQLGLSVEQAFDVCDAKYSLRAAPGNPKDDAAERAAVLRVGGVAEAVERLSDA